MQIRTLRSDERPALLELLDGWELGDGWRGRDFFRRYIEDDPTFADDNVWVAAEPGRLLACVQIFPRRLWLRGRGVSCGGIGSVFTRRDRRGEGLGTRLLEAAVRALKRRGFELSLLIASRVGFYRRLGWQVLTETGIELAAGLSTSSPAGGERLELAPFDPARDLAEVAHINASYSRQYDGPVIRDSRLWQASLCCAGNPRETVLVARREGRLVGYLRAVTLDGQLTLSEWGRRPDEAASLVALVGHLLATAPGGGAPQTVRMPAVRDRSFERELTRRGYRAAPVQTLATLVRVLDPQSVARRLGQTAPMCASEALPRHRFLFWPADRF